MMTTKQDRQTRQIEMVETHNLAISLRRLRESPGYDPTKWKRALYHAISMSSVSSTSEIAKIREAMELP